MDSHELERLPAVTHRASERPQGTEAAPRIDTMPAAVLSLQRTAGNESVSALLGQEEETERSPVRDVVESGGGSPLDSSTQSFMEERMGADFSDVRVHTGGQADESARSISAQAYTVGSDVVFRSGAYQPETEAGRHVIAHELAHVVQQKAGPVSGTPAAGGISLSDPSDSFEQAAVRTADQTMSGGPVAAQPAGGVQGATAQRAEDDDRDDVQPLLAQRDAAGKDPSEEEETAD